MIERDYTFENFNVSCDHCSFEDTFDETDFMDTVQSMKESGWQIRKVNGEWDHKCPTCAEDKS